MNETQANLFAPYAPPPEQSKEEIARAKYFADLHNAAQILDHLWRHLNQFEQKSTEHDAVIVKVKEAHSYIQRLREKYQKDDHARQKAHYDKMVEEGKKRMAESDAAVKEFEEKMAKRVAKIVQEQADQASKVEPTPPEPN